MRARIISMVVLAASLLVASQSLAQSDGSVTFGEPVVVADQQRRPSTRNTATMPRGGFLQDYVLREFNGPWAGALWGNDALTRGQGNGLYLAKGVAWRLDAQYAETPHHLNFIARSPFVQTTPGVFLLPNVLQQQNQLANGTNYNNGMKDVLAYSPVTPLGILTGRLQGPDAHASDQRLAVRGQGNGPRTPGIDGVRRHARDEQRHRTRQRRSTSASWTWTPRPATRTGRHA